MVTSVLSSDSEHAPYFSLVTAVSAARSTPSATTIMSSFLLAQWSLSQEWAEQAGVFVLSAPNFPLINNSYHSFPSTTPHLIFMLHCWMPEREQRHSSILFLPLLIHIFFSISLPFFSGLVARLLFR